MIWIAEHVVDYQLKIGSNYKRLLVSVWKYTGYFQKNIGLKENLIKTSHHTAVFMNVSTDFL